MNPDTLMLQALAGFAISVAALVALIWVASRDWLDDPVAEPRSHVVVLDGEGT